MVARRPVRASRPSLLPRATLGWSWTTDRLAKAARDAVRPLEQWLSRPTRVQPRRSYGVPGTAVYGGYLADGETDDSLAGTEKYRTYTRMLANTDIVAASVQYFTSLCGKAKWTFEPAEHSRGPALAALAEEILTSDPATAWPMIVARAAMSRYYGYSIQEWTAKRRPDGVITLADVAPRPQATIERWDLQTDGSVLGVWQRSPQTGEEHYLPRGKLLYLVDDSIHDSPEGLGLFRHCVRAAQRLARYEQLEGYGYETDLRGIPIGYAPYGELREWAAQQPDPAAALTYVQQMTSPVETFVSDHVRNPQLGLTLDSAVYEAEADSGATTPSSARKYQVDLLQGEAGPHAEVAAAIERNMKQIARVLGTEVILLGDGDRGSFALSRDKTQQLSLMIDSTLTLLADAFVRDLLRPLFRLNGWPLEAMPRLVPEAVQYRDAEQIAIFARDLAAAGVTLDRRDEAVAEMYQLAGLTPPDPELDALDLSLGGPPAPPPGLPPRDGSLPDNETVDLGETDDLTPIEGDDLQEAA